MFCPSLIFYGTIVLNTKPQYSHISFRQMSFIFLNSLVPGRLKKNVKCVFLKLADSLLFNKAALPDVCFVLILLDLYHFGRVKALRWRHHPGRLLRLNPARLAGCSHVRLSYQLLILIASRPLSSASPPAAQFTGQLFLRTNPTPWPASELVKTLI